MLAELQSLHRRIEDGIAEIGQLTSSDTPDLRALAPARVRLSQASTERTRFIISSVFPALNKVADDTLRAELTRLRGDLIAKRQASSEHVAHWSSRAVEADWPGYQRSSAKIRRMMTVRIAQERDILYGPLARQFG